MRYYPYCDQCERWGHPNCLDENEKLRKEIADLKAMREQRQAEIEELRANFLVMQAAMEDLGRKLNAPTKEDTPTRDMSTLSEPLPTQTNTGVNDDCTVVSLEIEEDMEDDLEELEEEELKEEPRLFAHKVYTVPLSFSLGMIHEKVEQQFGAFAGLLAKWHTDDPIKEEVTEVPSYTISQEEIPLFEEDGTYGDTRGREDCYDMKEGHVILGGPYLKRTPLPIDMVVLWSKNAGSFKVYKRRWK